MPNLENAKVFKMDYAGKELTVEIGKYAEQANGACLVRCGDTAVHVSVCMSETAREGMDFFPLSVDYEEKMYAVGKIPGGFKKREGRASDKAILTSRLIDRPIRPLFPKGIFNDVTVIATALSVDTNISPEPLAMLGSSIALSISSPKESINFLNFLFFNSMIPAIAYSTVLAAAIILVIMVIVVTSA